MKTLVYYNFNVLLSSVSFMQISCFNLAVVSPLNNFSKTYFSVDEFIQFLFPGKLFNRRTLCITFGLAYFQICHLPFISLFFLDPSNEYFELVDGIIQVLESIFTLI